MGALAASLVVSILAASGPSIQAGKDNVWPNGTYGTIRLFASHSGTASQPTIIRAANPGGAKVVADSLCGIWADDNTPVHDIIIEGFEVSGASVDGIRFWGGQRITIRNCWIHNNSNQGVGLYSNSGSTVQRCKIENNGVSTDARQRHGIYANGDHLTITGNLVRNNSGYGIHIWPVAVACKITQNVVYGHPAGAGIIVQRADTIAANANVVSNNSCFQNYIGICVSAAYQDAVAGNTVLNNQYSLDFYPPALGPVYADANTLDSPIFDPGKQAVLTTSATGGVNTGGWQN